MVKKVEYHPDAVIELRNAIIWYDDQADGLGLEFLLDVKSAESRICQNPTTWPSYEADTRHYLMQRFPYWIIYLVLFDKIQIVSVAHCKRKPGYWKHRLKFQ